jgi:cyclic-di-GMP-binding protein
MPADYSFDVVSQFDRQELVNALDQTRRELGTRFDFKNSPFEINLEAQEIIILAENESKLSAIKDVIQSKLVRRSLPLKILQWEKPEDASGAKVRQHVKLVQGISSDLARQISKYIRDKHPKAKPAIQGDTVRVSAKSKDELQTVIQGLREQEQGYDVALQFINYR